MNRAIRYTILAAAVSALGFSVGHVADAEPVQSQETGKVFEMRTYTTHEGKLPNLLARFQDHTMRIFEKHGMSNVGYWVPQDPPQSENTLIYIISHESREAADESWASFRNDPEWQQVSEQSQVDGEIVDNVARVFMGATDFSPIE